MKDTYPKAMAQVYEDEGGYTNDAADPGGPTNWGITIADARMYWKKGATAQDVKNMPKDVAADIYRKHYADPLHYDELPAGVDYAVLDYGINSGISRSAKVLQRLVGVPADGKIGTATLEAVKNHDPKALVNKIYDERLAFLQSLGTWSVFGRGWKARVDRGRKLALSMVGTAPTGTPEVAAGAAILTGAAVAVSQPHIWPWIFFGTILIVGIGYLIYRLANKNDPVVKG